MYAANDLKVGDEVFIKYGDYSDDELFEFYGFTEVPANLKVGQIENVKISKDQIISSCEQLSIDCKTPLDKVGEEDFVISVKVEG